jgi:hypothetical protein
LLRCANQKLPPLPPTLVRFAVQALKGRGESIAVASRSFIQGGSAPVGGNSQ